MISLIVATVGRVSELDRLFASLDAQTFTDFEVIVVDQNPDERLAAVLGRHPSLNLRRLSSPLGLSRARNVGLREAKGDIVAFPDDDCWYPQQLLDTVNHWFASHPQFDALLTIMRNQENQPILPRWAPSACRCVKKNVWDCVASGGLFVRSVVAGAVGCFNENLGVGAPTLLQSSEEIDYCLRAIERDFNLWYEPAISVHHPYLQSIERMRRTAYPYALGVGYVMRLHRYSLGFLLRRVLRALGGAVVSLCRTDVARAHLYLLRAAGQIRGYLWGPRDLARLPSRMAGPS